MDNGNILLQKAADIYRGFLRFKMKYRGVDILPAGAGNDLAPGAAGKRPAVFVWPLPARPKCAPWPTICRTAAKILTTARGRISAICPACSPRMICDTGNCAPSTSNAPRMRSCWPCGTWGPSGRSSAAAMPSRFDRTARTCSPTTTPSRGARHWRANGCWWCIPSARRL